MSSFWQQLTGGGKPQTNDDLKDIRQARTTYQDLLQTTQVNTKTDVDKSAITPETGTLIFKQIQASFDWLKKNPNAQLAEVLANRDATTAELQRLLKTDIPKRKFNNLLLAIPVILDEYETKKEITREQKYKFTNIITQEKSWFTKNQATATEMDFTQETLKINTALSDIFIDQALVSRLKTSIEWAQNQSTVDLKANLKDTLDKQKKAENAQLGLENATSTITKTALTVFTSFLIISLCLLSGSISANMAIGRVPAYRVLYFIYGCIPFFIPFVLLYAIYKRIKDGRFTLYAMLPLSIEMATTRLGKILWWPFYWIPDQETINAYKAFEDTLSKAIIVPV